MVPSFVDIIGIGLATNAVARECSDSLAEWRVFPVEVKCEQRECDRRDVGQRGWISAPHT